MKKILVTGWAWFIWSHLCKRLLDEWNEVICLDNLFTWRKKNISEFFSNNRFSFILHDITTPFRMQVDEIYNLACPASPVYYQKNPVETMKSSVLWAMNMLDLALKTKAKILQASTSEVYWDPQQHPQSESYWGNVNPVWKRSCYDEWKRCAETLFMDYHSQYWVETKIIRIFNTYWPNMNPDDWRVISNIIMQILKGENITIYWNWNQTRSFQYIDDLVEWMIRMMNCDWFTWPVNIWTNEEFTINELSSVILDLIPESKSKIVYSQLPSDDPMRRKADNLLAQANLLWKPSVSLIEWLKKTIEYFKLEL